MASIGDFYTPPQTNMPGRGPDGRPIGMSAGAMSRGRSGAGNTPFGAAGGQPVLSGAGSGSGVGTGSSMNPYDLGRAFNDYYGGKPTHQLVTEMQSGTSPTSNFGGAARASVASPAQPRATPQAAGDMNATQVGYFNGNGENGYSTQQEAGGQSNEQQGGPPPQARPAVPPPSGQAPPMQPPKQEAPPPAPPSPPPPPTGYQTPSNFTSGGTTPVPPTVADFAPQTAGAQDAAGQSQEAAAPGMDPVAQAYAASQTAGASQESASPGVTPKSAAQTYSIGYGGQQWNVTQPKPANWANMSDGQRRSWLANHAPGTTTPTGEQGNTGETVNGLAAGGLQVTPPVGADENGNPIGDGSGQPTDGELTTEDKYATSGGGGHWSLEGDNVFRADYDPAQLYPNHTTGGPGMTVNGLDDGIINSFFLSNNNNYIASAKVRQTFLAAWKAAKKIQMYSTGGLEDTAQLEAASEDFNKQNAKLALVGFKFNPFTESDGTGSSGDTTGEIDSLYNQDPNAPALSHLPATGGFANWAKRIFNVDANSPPEARASAFEAWKQWVAEQSAYEDKTKAAGQYSQAVGVYQNDPSRARSEDLANQIADNPDPTDWEQIRASDTAALDRGTRETAGALGEAYARRGLGPATGAGAASEMMRQSEGDKARHLGDLSIQQSQAQRQGQLQALDALGNTFSRYAGGEAAARQALGNVIMGAPGDYQYGAAGIANMSANNAAIQVARDQLAQAQRNMPSSWEKFGAWAGNQSTGVMNLVGSVI